jgi:hypothetical protein
MEKHSAPPNAALDELQRNQHYKRMGIHSHLRHDLRVLPCVPALARHAKYHLKGRRPQGQRSAPPVETGLENQLPSRLERVNLLCTRLSEEGSRRSVVRCARLHRDTQSGVPWCRSRPSHDVRRRNSSEYLEGANGRLQTSDSANLLSILQSKNGRSGSKRTNRTPATR